jgi:hypothetical protein
MTVQGHLGFFDFTCMDQPAPKIVPNASPTGCPAKWFAPHPRWPGASQLPSKSTTGDGKLLQQDEGRASRVA